MYISYNTAGIGYISGFSLVGTTPSYAATPYWGIVAVDQEGQYTEGYFYITVSLAILINISGYWYDQSGSQLYIGMNSLQDGGTGSGYWTSGQNYGRPSFSITVTSAANQSISIFFPDYGGVSASCTSNYIYQSNGTYWYR